MVLLCDLDNTLVDGEERFRTAGAEPSRNYPEQHNEWLKKVQSAESLAADEPIPLMQRLVQRMSAAPNTRVIYLTARSIEFAPVTLAWLKRYNFPNGALIMRPLDLLIDSDEYKQAEIKKIQAQLPNDQILALDDDPSGQMAKTYKALGCLHLKPTWCMYDHEGAPNPAYAL